MIIGKVSLSLTAWELKLSNKDPEKDYGNLTDVLQFVFHQFMKDIYVSIPGIIETYDPETKRCKVRPAINTRLTSGVMIAPSSIINVPVIWPGGGGFVFLSPLPPGSPVEIKFSQRGITAFKETFLISDPGTTFFDKHDAHVIPGYGALGVTPGSITGACLQKEDGSIFICIEDDKIKIKGDIEMLNGIITGPNVFNGPASSQHGHNQGSDSAGDGEQKTDPPS